MVLNATQRADGAWKALANEEIFRSVKSASVIYRAELAARLVELGYRVERTHVVDLQRQDRSEVCQNWSEQMSPLREDVSARIDLTSRRIELSRAVAIPLRARFHALASPT